MSEAEDKTILDYLNWYCWRAVLQYVPVKDIIRSERVSLQWQNIILEYLRSIHIGIGHNPHSRDREAQKAHWLLPKNDHYSSFKSWTDKLGTSVVACVNCGSDDNLKVVVENCLNLRSITVSFLSDNFKLNNRNKYLTQLKLLHFNTCRFVSDDCFSQFITGDTLEELDFVSCNYLTGQCLTNLKSKRLKRLGFRNCDLLSIRQLLSAADRLTELTNLELFAVGLGISQKVYRLLNKLTKLENLHFEGYPIRCDDFFNSACSLRYLKVLAVNYYVTDKVLETVTRCCQELETLSLTSCSAVTGRGVAAACAHAGARLTSLGVCGSLHLTDDHVVDCVRACPNLRSLDVSRSRLVTVSVVGRAAAARRVLRARGTLNTLSLVLGQCHHSGWDCSLRDRYKDDGLVVSF